MLFTHRIGSAPFNSLCLLIQVEIAGVGALRFRNAQGRPFADNALTHRIILLRSFQLPLLANPSGDSGS